MHAQGHCAGYANCLDMNVKFAPTEQLQESEAASATGAESTQHAPQFGY